ncbi:hypothetical protein [Streptomyces sp. NPDC102476]|uniref:hypothetical protein n=1 Tax=Streptomyces sp. NPDC102476 TaxID=3366181 RepID=UPI00380593D0
MTASVPGVAGFALAFGCLTTLLLVPDGGAWRWWTTLAGVLAPAVGFTVQAMGRIGDRDPNGDAAASSQPAL